jgi:uncharacterized protein YndB with AHSA1/START domain
MKWLLWAVGIVLALVVLVVVIGALLPEKHTATRSARFHQQSDAIWQAITTYQNFPSWRSSVKSVDALASKNAFPAWREVDSHGNILPMQVLESDPPLHLVTMIADPSLPFGGTWTIEITPAPDGSNVRITENGEIHNIIFRFLSRFVFGYTLTMDTYLKDLGKKFGGTPAIEP